MGQKQISARKGLWRELTVGNASRADGLMMIEGEESGQEVAPWSILLEQMQLQQAQGTDGHHHVCCIQVMPMKLWCPSSQLAGTAKCGVQPLLLPPG